MQYELKKCQDQTGMKNDKLDDKTRWELMPLDCLEDIARVYTEGAKKYGDNNWQNLENGYERYKGALLRHLYASTYEEFDPETKVRHEAAVAWNSIALLYYAKHGRKASKLFAKGFQPPSCSNSACAWRRAFSIRSRSVCIFRFPCLRRFPNR